MTQVMHFWGTGKDGLTHLYAVGEPLIPICADPAPFEPSLNLTTDDKIICFHCKKLFLNFQDKFLVKLFPDIYETKETLIKTVFQLLGERIHKNAVAKGFWEEERNFGEMIALMHSELSECLEGHREDANDYHLPQFKNITVEFADVIIRILDTCFVLNLPLSDALLEKITYNETRPRKHGKRY